MVIVQRNVYEPGNKPLTVEVGEDGFAINAPPAPAICVQVPVPIVGVLPASETLLTPHKFTVAAVTVAAVALAEAVIITVSRVAVQPGVLRLHSNL